MGGPGLAAEAARLGLIDEYRLFVSPVVLGGGTPFFPRTSGSTWSWSETRTFGSRVVYLRYRSLSSKTAAGGARVALRP